MLLVDENRGRLVRGELGTASDLCTTAFCLQDDTKLKLYRHQFDFFDKDKDGKINAKELLEILHSLGRNATESSAKVHCYWLKLV